MVLYELIYNVSYIIGYLFGYYILGPILAVLSTLNQFAETLPF